MKTILFLLFAVMLCSCKNTSKKEILENQEPIKKLTKLEQLYLLPKDSIYEFYDLSNDSIKELPDLSGYSIKKLDLSHNQIDNINYKNLPRGIKSLNLSNNIFMGDFFFESEKVASLQELDMSHNKITDCLFHSWLKRIYLNDNDLTGRCITIGGNNPKYLNISNNPKMSNIVGFEPEKIDTIIRTNIKNNKKLIFFRNAEDWKIID